MNQIGKVEGLFSFNELITSDLDQAKRFYGELFGWTFTTTKTIYGNPYLVIHKDKTLIGGMMLKEGNVPDDVPLCWDPYATVDNVDVSAKQVVKLGGEVILPPTDIPEFGRFCVIKDPQGVALNIISYFNEE
ncbi:MAG: VOC family protein [Desulfovibrio sp.]